MGQQLSRIILKYLLFPVVAAAIGGVIAGIVLRNVEHSFKDFSPTKNVNDESIPAITEDNSVNIRSHVNPLEKPYDPYIQYQDLGGRKKAPLPDDVNKAVPSNDAGSTRSEVTRPPLQDKNLSGRKKAPRPDAAEKAAPSNDAGSTRSEKIRPPQQERTLIALVKERRIKSDWKPKKSWANYISGKKVKVRYTPDREQDAAEIVYRLEISGANVTYRAVLDFEAGFHSKLLYHRYDLYQTASAIRNLIEDIEWVEPKRKDEPGEEITLWLD